VKFRTAVVALAVLGLAFAAVYARRRRAAATPPPVRLGFADGSEQALAANDPGAAELLSAAADVRRGLEIAG